MGKRRVESEETEAKKGKKLLVDPEKPWYLVKIKEAWEVSGPRAGAAAELAEIQTKAERIYKSQVSLYDQQRDMSKSDRDWLKTVISSGTTSDKCSTFQVQIAEAPLYGADYLLKLLELARSTKRHESSQAMAALEKVFDTILPPAGLHKMVYMKQRKWERPGDISDKSLLIVYFEDVVKRCFMEFLKLVEIVLQDQIAHSRETAMRTLCQLGCKKDEQLNNVLSLLTNKLGDVDRKLASRAMFYLQEIVNAQKEATEPVIGQVEQLVERPGVSEKAQYYGLTFLSQIMLSHSMPQVTERLVKLYLAILKNHVIPSIVREAEKAKAAKKQKAHKTNKKKQEQVETELAPATARLAKVVTTGLNRALPFYKGSLGLLDELTTPIIKMISTSSFATSLQALSLYFQVASANKSEGLGPAFLKTVESVLEKPEAVIEAGSHPQLLTLVYKILIAAELSNQLTEKLLKCLFRLVIKINGTAFTLSALFMLAEVLETKKATWAMINVPEDGEDSSCLWAVRILQRHYDQRVSKLATSILEGSPAVGILDGQSPFEVCTPAASLAALLN